MLSMAEAMTKPDEILKNAVENVLADDGFNPSSRSAVEDARKLIQWFSLPNSKEVFYELQIGVTCLPFYFIPLFLFSELMDKDEVLDVGEKIKKLYMNHKNRRCSRQCI